MRAVSLVLLTSAHGSVLPWRRGDTTVLTVNTDWTSKLAFSGHVWLGLAPNNTGGQAVERSTVGTDRHGNYDELALGTSTVRFYSGLDAFVFERQYTRKNGTVHEVSWPRLAPAAEVAPRLKALAWLPKYMLSGGLFSPWSNATAGGAGLAGNDGPLFVFDASQTTAAADTLAFSALDHFASNTPALQHPHLPRMPARRPA